MNSVMRRYQRKVRARAAQEQSVDGGTVATVDGVSLGSRVNSLYSMPPPMDDGTVDGAVGPSDEIETAKAMNLEVYESAWPEIF